MDSNFRQIDIAAEAYKSQQRGIQHRRRNVKGIAVDDMSIRDPANPFGKKPGRYVLLDAQSGYAEDSLVPLVARYLRLLARGKVNLNRRPHILVVGLGNKDYNPDSLGPKVIDRLNVNYHLRDQEYEKARARAFISAVAPGVMAATGLESSDLVRALLERHRFDFVIAIDALATRVRRRLNRVLQLTDTGIAPGSGVGNHRKELDEDSLGLPVLAVGVATVIDTLSLVSEALNDSKLESAEIDKVLASPSLDPERQLVMATKDIDREVVHLARVIARSIEEAFL